MGKSRKSLPSDGAKQGCSLLAFLLMLVLEALERVVLEEQKIKDIKFGKEDITRHDLSLLTLDFVMHHGYLRHSSSKILSLCPSHSVSNSIHLSNDIQQVLITLLQDLEFSSVFLMFKHFIPLFLEYESVMCSHIRSPKKESIIVTCKCQSVSLALALGDLTPLVL